MPASASRGLTGPPQGYVAEVPGCAASRAVEDGTARSVSEDHGSEGAQPGPARCALSLLRSAWGRHCRRACGPHAPFLSPRKHHGSGPNPELSVGLLLWRTLCGQGGHRSCLSPISSPRGICARGCGPGSRRLHRHSGCGRSECSPPAGLPLAFGGKSPVGVQSHQATV